jgi:DNA ligase (NAD+)
MSRKIEFIRNCPKCHSELDLTATMVKCQNPNCPSILVGRVLNFCNCLRIQNIGYNTLDTLYQVGLLKKGIRSLYKLRKKTHEIENLEGFGKLKTRKIVAEIESKRRLKDYELFGSIGIESLSIKTFQSIFSAIRYEDFLNMINVKNFDLMFSKLVQIDGIGEKKAEVLVQYLKDAKNRIEVLKLVDELSVYSSYGESDMQKPIAVISGFRDAGIISALEKKGFTVTDGWTNKATCLVVKDKNQSTTKINKAASAGIPVYDIEEILKEKG